MIDFKLKIYTITLLAGLIFCPTRAFSMIQHEEWLVFTMTENENIIDIFRKVDLSVRSFNNLLNESDHALHLVRASKGDEIGIKLFPNGALKQLRFKAGEDEIIDFRLEGARFSSERKSRRLYNPLNFKSGVIRNSLFQAAKNEELPLQVIIQYTNIFEGSINFSKDTRKGDLFSILYSDTLIPEIIAAEYVNNDKVYKAYKYTFKNGDTGYYNEEGENLNDAFLPAPLDSPRISSHFNPNRLHPIFNIRIPHRGVDYAAPTGTPVYASNKGVVTKAGYTKANGKYIFISHGNKFVTKYLHLSKINVNAGDRVDKKEVVGLVGNTGYSTGPHLHYELLIDGVHVDPATAIGKIKSTKPLRGAEKERFLWFTEHNQAFFDKQIRQQKLARNI